MNALAWSQQLTSTILLRNLSLDWFHTKGKSGKEGLLIEIPNRGKRSIISAFTSVFNSSSSGLSLLQCGPVSVVFGTGWHHAALPRNLPRIIHRFST
jgi:hypothetical protein